MLGTVHTVRRIVAQVLGTDESQVAEDDTLLGTLGFDSLDLMSLLAGVEHEMGVKLRLGEIAEYIRGGLAERDFADSQGVITAEGLERIRSVMPHVDPQALANNTRVESVLEYFTVQNLADLIGRHRTVHGPGTQG